MAGRSSDPAEATPPPDNAAALRLRVGVLAIQGDFEAHSKIVESLGAEAREVRTPEQLEGLDALIIDRKSVV